MASKRIGILKDGNDNQEDPPRASKREGDSKARKNHQKDPSTSSSAETTIKQQDSFQNSFQNFVVCHWNICGREEFQPKMFFGFGLD